MSFIPIITRLMVTVIAVTALSITATHAQSNGMGNEASEASNEQFQQLLNFFVNADMNADGIVTEIELEEAIQKPFKKMDRNRNGHINANDAPGFARKRFMSRVSPIINELDTNADDSLSYSEFSKGPKTAFAMFDSDDSGSIEIRIVIDAMSQ